MFMGKPAAEKLLLISVAAYLTFVKICTHLLPFRTLSSLIQTGDKKTASMPERESGEITDNIARRVRSVSKKLPWNSSCLVQAAAAKLLLRRRGIPSSICFGVRKNGAQINQLGAHAWLMIDEDIVLGGDIADQYTQVSTLT